MIFVSGRNLLLQVMVFILVISKLGTNCKANGNALLNIYGEAAKNFKKYGEDNDDLHNKLLDPILASAQELALRTFYCDGDAFTKVFIRLKALELTTTPADIKKLLASKTYGELYEKREFGENNEKTGNQNKFDDKWEEIIVIKLIEAAEEATIADMIARIEASNKNEEFRVTCAGRDLLSMIERPIIDVTVAYIESLKSLKEILEKPGNTNVDVVQQWVSDWLIKSPLLFRQALLQLQNSAIRMARDRKYRRYFMNRILTGIWFYADITRAAHKLFGEYRTGFDNIYPTMYDNFLHNFNSTFIEEFNSFYHRPNFISESATEGNTHEIMNRMIEYSFRGVFALSNPMKICFLGVGFSSMQDSCFQSIVNMTHQEMVLIYKLIIMYMALKKEKRSIL